MVLPVPVLKLHDIYMAAVEKRHIPSDIRLLSRFIPGGVAIAGIAVPMRGDIHPYRAENHLASFGIKPVDINEVTPEICRRRIPGPPFLPERFLFQHLHTPAVTHRRPGIIGKPGRLYPHSLTRFVTGLVGPEVEISRLRFSGGNAAQGDSVDILFLADFISPVL